MTDEKPTALISDNSKHSLDQRSGSPQRPQKIPRISTVEGGEEDEDGEVEERETIVGDEDMKQKNPRLQRYLVAIEYIGTRFAGAQKQPNGRTVIGVLEEAFHKFIGQPVSIFCSSRTWIVLGGVDHQKVDMELTMQRGMCWLAN